MLLMKTIVIDHNAESRINLKVSKVIKINKTNKNVKRCSTIFTKYNFILVQFVAYPLIIFDIKVFRLQFDRCTHLKLFKNLHDNNQCYLDHKVSVDHEISRQY